MRLATSIEERVTDACVSHRHAHMCVLARVCVWVWAHASAPNRASTFRRRGPRAVRLAGVFLSIGVQREHRRVEHCGGDEHGPGMRCFRPGGTPPRQDALGRSSMRRGRCARRHRRRAHVCVRAHVQALACAGVHGCMYSCA